MVIQCAKSMSARRAPITSYAPNCTPPQPPSALRLDVALIVYVCIDYYEARRVFWYVLPCKLTTQDRPERLLSPKPKPKTLPNPNLPPNMHGITLMWLWGSLPRAISPSFSLRSSCTTVAPENRRSSTTARFKACGYLQDGETMLSPGTSNEQA